MFRYKVWNDIRECDHERAFVPDLNSIQSVVIRSSAGTPCVLGGFWQWQMGPTRRWDGDQFRCGSIWQKPSLRRALPSTASAPQSRSQASCAPGLGLTGEAELEDRRCSGDTKRSAAGATSAEMTDGHHFNNILLGGRGGTVSSSAAVAWSILVFFFFTK